MKNTSILRLISVINLLLIIPVNNAQTPSTDFLEGVIEDIAVNNENEKEINWENEIEELSERISQPINLNSATKEQLEQLPFLTDLQVENLLAYVYIHGQMQTVYELQDILTYLGGRHEPTDQSFHHYSRVSGRKLS